jgi:hypothetical protein
MATQTYGVDKNSIYDSVTETTNSGATMTAGLEVNIDLAKFTSKDEVLRGLNQIRGAIANSANWPA